MEADTNLGKAHYTTKYTYQCPRCAASPPPQHRPPGHPARPAPLATTQGIPPRSTPFSPSHLRVAARSSNTSTASSFWSWTLSTGRQLAAASPLLRRTHVRQARRGRHGCNRDRRMDLRPDTPPPTDPALILGWHNHQRLPATGRQLAAASPPFRQTHVRQARRGRHGRNRNRRTLLRLDAPLPADHPPLLGWHVN